MQIDLAQVLTHAVGFLIAMWLVKKYAWERLLRFIEYRRRTIAESFSRIEAGQLEIDTQKKRFAAELDKIEATRRARIQQAAREAEKLAADIREEARRESVAMKQKARQDIALEVDKANVTLRNRMVDAVIAATEKILEEKLDRERHARLVEDFLDRLEEGDTRERKEGGAA